MSSNISNNSNNNSSCNNCSGCDLIGLAASLAIFISQQVDPDNLDVFASFFSAIGDNLGIIAASK